MLHAALFSIFLHLIKNYFKSIIYKKNRTILFAQHFIRHNYYIFANKMMRKDRSINLEDVPHILKGGLQKNVRFVGSSLKDTNPIIQIDGKKFESLLKI